MTRIFSSKVSSVYRVTYKQYADDDFCLCVKVAAKTSNEAFKKVTETLCYSTNMFANNDGYVVSVEDLGECILV